MKMLTIVGTAAMFMVGGGILTHGIPGAPDLIHHAATTAGQVPRLGGALKALAPTLLDVATGILAGTFALLALSACGALAKLFRKRA